MADEEFAVHGGWLVGLTDKCTCDMAPYPHQPGCGMEPIATIDEVLAALSEHAERVIAEGVAMRAPQVVYVPDDPDVADGPEWRDMVARARERAGDAGVLIIPQALAQQGEAF